MKRSVSLILALVICLLLCACGQSGAETESTTVPATTQAPTTIATETTEALPNYAEIVPEALQGVWCDTAQEGILSLYAFQGNQVQISLVTMGAGAADVTSGTYTVEDGQVSYDFGGATGFSLFTYENDVFAMANAENEEMKKLSSADILDYLLQEEASENQKGVICLADLIINYYGDTTESTTAAEKKEAANASIKAAGEAALRNLRTDYDKVQKLTWYQHKNQPQYVDLCCYIYPYIGRMDDGYTWLRVAVNYTDAQTDAGWIFFKKIIFSVDGNNTTKVFNYYDILRDNDTEVWETADFEPTSSEIRLLRSIANSEETIIRFEGDEYYEDHIVTQKEKAAILDVLTAYDYLVNYSE